MKNVNDELNLFVINKEYLNFMTKMGIKGIEDFEYGISTYLEDTMYFIPIDLNKDIDFKNSLNNLLIGCMLPIENSEHFVTKQKIEIELNKMIIGSNEFNKLSKLEKLLVLINKNKNLINLVVEQIFKNNWK